MIDDLLEPTIKRLRELVGLTSNTAMSILAVSIGIEASAKKRTELMGDIQQLVEQVGRLQETALQFEELASHVEHHGLEIDENSVAQMVEKSADALIVAQALTMALRLKQNDCALRMLALDPDLIPHTIKELSSYDNGPEQLARWAEAIGSLSAEIEMGAA